MRWLARKENVPLIDLNRMTRTLYEAMGPEASKRAFVHYPAGTYPGQEKPLADNTHFNPYGAYEIARCIAEGLKQQVPTLARHLKDVPPFDPRTPTRPTRSIGTTRRSSTCRSPTAPDPRAWRTARKNFPKN